MKKILIRWPNFGRMVQIIDDWIREAPYQAFGLYERTKNFHSKSLDDAVRFVLPYESDCLVENNYDEFDGIIFVYYCTNYDGLTYFKNKMLDSLIKNHPKMPLLIVSMCHEGQEKELKGAQYKGFKKLIKENKLQYVHFSTYNTSIYNEALEANNVDLHSKINNLYKFGSFQLKNKPDFFYFFKSKSSFVPQTFTVMQGHFDDKTILGRLPFPLVNIILTYLGDKAIRGKNKLPIQVFILFVKQWFDERKKTLNGNVPQHNFNFDLSIEHRGIAYSCYKK
jgi:hypothetical protein